MFLLSIYLHIFRKHFLLSILNSRGMTDESSGSSSGGGLQTRILSTFLNELDGIVAQDCGIEGTLLF